MTEKHKILMIDDEADFCHFMKLNLESTNKYKVEVATSGQKGIMLSKSVRPDLILLDIFMPDMDGTIVAEHILEDPSTKDIPIVFLTAVVTKRDVNSGSGMVGGRHVLAKPVATDELVSTIRTILQ